MRIMILRKSQEAKKIMSNKLMSKARDLQKSMKRDIMKLMQSATLTRVMKEKRLMIGMEKGIMVGVNQTNMRKKFNKESTITSSRAKTL